MFQYLPVQPIDAMIAYPADTYAPVSYAAQTPACQAAPQRVEPVPPTVPSLKVTRGSNGPTIRIPSSLVIPTIGSTEYVEHERTPHWIRLLEQQQQERQSRQRGISSAPTKKRFTLCPHFTEHRTCPYGTNCRDVHARVWELETPVLVAPQPRTVAPRATTKVAPQRQTTVPHVNYSDLTARCTAQGPMSMMPAGRTVVVHDRRSRETVEYDTSYVMVTRGSQDWASIPNDARRVFHCMHFRESGVCPRGEHCTFFHVPVASIVVDSDLTSTSMPCKDASSPQPSPMYAPLQCPLAGPIDALETMYNATRTTICASDEDVDASSSSGRSWHSELDFIGVVSSPSLKEVNAQTSSSSSASVIKSLTPRNSNIVFQYRHNPYGAVVMME